MLSLQYAKKPPKHFFCLSYGGNRAGIYAHKYQVQNYGSYDSYNLPPSAQVVFLVLRL